jgi:cytochrome oxidase Cu insertion factor (SCO1/SenC/PrrC family)
MPVVVFSFREQAVGFANFYSRSHSAVIRVYDETGKLIEVHRHKGDLEES